MGKGVCVRVYGGYRSVGGNCVVVEDGKAGFRVMMDQGLNFRAFSKYFGGYVEPISVKELVEVGALPPPEAYKDVDAVFVSHLHLDHLGAMSMAERAGAELYVPHVPVLLELARSWEWGWKSLLLPSGDVSRYAKQMMEWKGVVKPARVSHSAYPSYAFLVYTSEGTVLYTGDLRVDPSPLGIDTVATLEEVAGKEGVDVLVVEGTNLGREVTPLDYEQAKAVLDRVLSTYSRNLLFVAYHPLDVETLVAVYGVLSKYGYSLVLLHDRYSAIADHALDDVGLDLELYLYDLRGGAAKRGFKHVEYLGSPRLCRLAEAKPSEKVAVALSHMAIDELRLLGNQGLELAGALLVQLASEPKGEEMRIMEARLGAWLRRLGVHAYRLRVSGHYYPHQLEHIIRATKPRAVLTVHSTFSNIKLV